jgi:hypothetical protein
MFSSERAGYKQYELGCLSRWSAVIDQKLFDFLDAVPMYQMQRCSFD